MSTQSNGVREPDNAMARESGAVSEDVQPITTDEKAETTAHGSLQGTGGPEGRETVDKMKTESSVDRQ
jgi:hypothetical protein